MPPSITRNVDAMNNGKARVCMVSQRDISRQAAWCSNYEFEDVISSVDDVELISLQAGWAFPQRLRLLKRLIFRRVSRRLTHLNPGIHAVTLQSDYDIFVFVCMTPQDLLCLSAVKGWRERCKTKICYMTELWTNWLDKYDFQLGLLKDFDHVFLCFSGSVDALGDFLGKPCHHVPLGADVLRFTPYPKPPARCVDVYSLGRRIPAMHEAFLKMAAKREIFYIHDTIPSDFVQPANHRQHRDLVANIAKRSRYFVTYPALFGSDETQGQSEVGARFFEGAAAGAALIGQAPTTTVFGKDFGWADSVISVGPSEAEFLAATEKFEKEPELLAALSRKNAVEALRRFDWVYRWKEMLRIAGFAPSFRLQQREEHLNQTAALAESFS